jgi:hypothetical protein
MQLYLHSIELSGVCFKGYFLIQQPVPALQFFNQQSDVAAGEMAFVFFAVGKLPDLFKKSAFHRSALHDFGRSRIVTASPRSQITLGMLREYKRLMT